MKFKSILWSLLLAALQVSAQSVADTKAMADAFWLEHSSNDGLLFGTAMIPMMGGIQSVNVITAPPEAGFKVGFCIPDTMATTSEMAAKAGASAAVNGSYFDMSNGRPVCFVKANNEICDTTISSEFDLRVNGAVAFDNSGSMQLIPWSKEMEHLAGGDWSNVLAAGPMLIKEGEVLPLRSSDMSFIFNRHPRSAIARKADGAVMLVAVDGRSHGNADGMTLVELADFLLGLGAVEALNLDGGGSTTLWMHGAPANGVVSHPSDNGAFDHHGERRVGNMLYLYR